MLFLPFCEGPKTAKPITRGGRFFLGEEASGISLVSPLMA